MVKVAKGAYLHKKSLLKLPPRRRQLVAAFLRAVVANSLWRACGCCGPLLPRLPYTPLTIHCPRWPLPDKTRMLPLVILAGLVLIALAEESVRVETSHVGGVKVKTLQVSSDGLPRHTTRLSGDRLLGDDHSRRPTALPSSSPTLSPTSAPSSSPTKKPHTKRPNTKRPKSTIPPTALPSSSPTLSPTSAPSSSPTKKPHSKRPHTAKPHTKRPHSTPTAHPTASPTSAVSCLNGSGQGKLNLC